MSFFFGNKRREKSGSSPGFVPGDDLIWSFAAAASCEHAFHTVRAGLCLLSVRLSVGSLGRVGALCVWFGGIYVCAGFLIGRSGAV
jgi:hypothetical protein